MIANFTANDRGVVGVVVRRGVSHLTLHISDRFGNMSACITWMKYEIQNSIQDAKLFYARHLDK
jgi:hypothetical protein